MKKKFITKLLALTLMGSMLVTAPVGNIGRDEVQAAETPVSLGSVVGLQGSGMYVRWIYYSDSKTLVVKARGGGKYIDTADVEAADATGEGYKKAVAEAETIYICDGIKNIGDFSLSGAKKATKLRLPDTVSEIGHRAFWNLGVSTTDGTSILISSIDTVELNNCFYDAKIKDLFFSETTAVNHIGIDVEKITNLYLAGCTDRDAALAIEGVSDKFLNNECTNIYFGKEAKNLKAQLDGGSSAYIWTDSSTTQTEVAGTYYFTVPLSGPGVEDDDSNYEGIAENLGYGAMISLPTTVSLEYGNAYGWQTKKGYAYESASISPFGEVNEGTTITLDVSANEGDLAEINLYDSSNQMLAKNSNGASEKVWNSAAINGDVSDPVKLGIFVDVDGMTSAEYGSVKVGSYTYHVTTAMGDGAGGSAENAVVSEEVAGLYDEDNGNIMVASWSSLNGDGTNCGLMSLSSTKTAIQYASVAEGRYGNYKLVLPSTIDTISNIQYNYKVPASISASEPIIAEITDVYAPSSVTTIKARAFSSNDVAKTVNLHSELDAKPDGWMDGFDRDAGGNTTVIADFAGNRTGWPCEQ